MAEPRLWTRLWVQVVAGVIVLLIVSVGTSAYPPARDLAVAAWTRTWQLAFYEVAIWQAALVALVLLIARAFVKLRKPPTMTPLQRRIIHAFAMHDEVWLDLDALVDAVRAPKVTVRAAINDMPQLMRWSASIGVRPTVCLTDIGLRIVADYSAGSSAGDGE